MNADADAGVSTVSIFPDYFPNWLAKRVITLSRDSLISKGAKLASSQHWLVGLRGDSPLLNFERMVSETNSSFWAFKNSQFVTKQIFDLQADDKMLFLFFNSLGDGSAMSYDKPNDPIILNGWAEVVITDPYYICLDGEQAQFFEKIRDNTGNLIPIPNRKWVHFIDFKVIDFKKLTDPIKFNRGDAGNFLAQSANQGGALMPWPIRNRDEIMSLILSSDKRKKSA